MHSNSETRDEGVDILPSFRTPGTLTRTFSTHNIRTVPYSFRGPDPQPSTVYNPFTAVERLGCQEVHASLSTYAGHPTVGSVHCRSVDLSESSPPSPLSGTDVPFPVPPDLPVLQSSTVTPDPPVPRGPTTVDPLDTGNRQPDVVKPSSALRVRPDTRGLPPSGLVRRCTPRTVLLRSPCRRVLVDGRFRTEPLVRMFGTTTFDGRTELLTWIRNGFPVTWRTVRTGGGEGLFDVQATP